MTSNLNTNSSEFAVHLIQNGPLRVMLEVRVGKEPFITVPLTNEQLRELAFNAADIVRERLRHGLFKVEEALAKMKEEKGNA